MSRILYSIWFFAMILQGMFATIAIYHEETNMSKEYDLYGMQYSINDEELFLWWNKIENINPELFTAAP